MITLEDVQREKQQIDASLLKWLRSFGQVTAVKALAISQSLAQRAVEVTMQITEDGDKYDAGIALLESLLADLRDMKARGAAPIPAPMPDGN